MVGLSELVGKIGDFEIIYEGAVIFSFEGTIVEDNNVIVVNGRAAPEHSRSIDMMKPYRVVGTVDGFCVTLVDAYILPAYRCAEDEIFVTIKAKASEILVGRQVRDDGHIRIATMNLPEITWFFSDRIFESSVGVNRKHPTLLEYRFLDEITISDDYGTLTISQTMEHFFSQSKEEYTSIPILQYSFTTPVSLSVARSQIAKARNLFLYFADGYIPLHDIYLADEQTSADYYPTYCDFKLVFNSIEGTEPINEPFFVTTNSIKSNIQTIWSNWNELYAHKFISALYYEIICNRSTRINRFLNFSQAIDLFETIYRDAEARSLAPRRDIAQRHFLPLSLYIKDSLLQLKDDLNLKEEDIDSISQNISDARNYFTHYNDAKYREPSLPEIFAMCRVLHLVFLGLVYRQLGIPSGLIAKARKCREYANFDRDISVILRKPIDNVDYTNFFG